MLFFFSIMFSIIYVNLIIINSCDHIRWQIKSRARATIFNEVHHVVIMNGGEPLTEPNPLAYERQEFKRNSLRQLLKGFAPHRETKFILLNDAVPCSLRRRAQKISRISCGRRQPHERVVYRRIELASYERHQYVAHLVARRVELIIRRVVARSEAMHLSVTLYVGARYVEQRTDDVSRARAHPTEPRDARATQNVHHDRLGLIILLMRDGDERIAVALLLARNLAQERVSSLARRRLYRHAIFSRIRRNVLVPYKARDTSFAAKLLNERGIGERIISANAVLEMRRHHIDAFARAKRKHHIEQHE